jgi:hypothetical protein
MYHITYLDKGNGIESYVVFDKGVRDDWTKTAPDLTFYRSKRTDRVDK